MAESSPESPPADEPRPGGYREITLSAILFGLLAGAILNAAITYAGLKIGFTIVGSTILAVLGFGVLRGLLRQGTILEVNIGQTIGSAVNTPNSGVIFTVPVLFLLGIPLIDGTTPNQNFWLISLACVAGAVLGCAFIVPLRKQMLDIERLRFPSATAVGAILKSPGAGATKSLVLLAGILISTLLALPAQLPQIRVTAALEDVDELVYREKISVEDKLRTEMIHGWIERGEAPPEVVDHGRWLIALESARNRLSEAAAADQELRRRQRIAALQQQVAEAAEEAGQALAEATRQGGHAVGGYPDELAVRAALASAGRLDWSGLRDRRAGWATRPLWGYSDLQLRMPRELAPGGEQIDFAFNGLGNPSEVLSERVDRDRNGRADLLVTDSTVDVGRWIGLPAEMQLVFAIAPFALGAGYLTGRPGLFVLAGGVLAYLVLNPVLFNLALMPATVTAVEAPEYGFMNVNRPLGIGLLLGGALMGVLASLPAIREALRSIAAASKTKGGSDELGLRVLVVAVIGALIFLFVIADLVEQQPLNHVDPVTGLEMSRAEATTRSGGYTIGFSSQESLDHWHNEWTEDQRAEALQAMNADKPGLLSQFNPHLRAAIIALVGAAWIWFAGIIIAQCTGMTDWSPISGMALLTVVLVLFLAGVGHEIGAVMLGAALCVAITCAADMMADLKTGYIVGAMPRKQQIVELIFTGIGPLITMGVLLLIARANMEKFGVPIGPGTDTTAPQAQALEAVIVGVQGGSIPYALYGCGALLGGLLGLGSFSGLGVLVGLSMYLPMIYIATYGIGCLVNMAMAKFKGKRWAEEWGVPLAAGLIVGDALLGLLVNMFVLVQA